MDIHYPSMPTPNRTRTANLMLRLDADERRMIEALAERQGLSMADAMRQALRRDAERLGLSAVPKRWQRRKGKG